MVEEMYVFGLEITKKVVLASQTELVVLPVLSEFHRMEAIHLHGSRTRDRRTLWNIGEAPC